MRTAGRVATEGEASAEGREAERERILRGLRTCLWVFLGVRVGLTVLAVLGTALLPALEPANVPGWAAPPQTPGWHNLVTAWERFDALWFLRIADSGYGLTDGSAAFFPLYPLAIRFLTPVFGGAPLAAALAISNLAFLAALVVLYFLTASEWGEAAARRAVVLLAVLPTAFFFLAPYSESLYLLLALLAFWGARRERWLLAAIAGAGAAATRSVGIVLAAALLAEAIHRWREDGRDLLPGAAAAAAVAAGTGAYLLFWELRAGEALAPLTFQQNWQRELSLPWETLAAGTGEAFRWIGQYPGGYHLLDWLLVVPALVAAAWVALRARPAYTVFVAGSLLVPLSYIFEPRPFMSLPRFLVVVFPLVWAAAVPAGRRPGLPVGVATASAALLGLMTVLFVGWYFVF